MPAAAILGNSSIADKDIRMISDLRINYNLISNCSNYSNCSK